MIGVFSKLLYILTLSPFSSQNGLLKNLKLDSNGENEELLDSDSDPLNKNRTEMRQSGFSLSDTRSTIEFGRHLEVERQMADYFMMTPLQELAMSSVGVLITGVVLIKSKNQTIVFFIIFALGAYSLAVLISIIELLLESEEEKTSWLKSFDLDTKFRNMASAILIVTVIFQIYYYFYPSPTAIVHE